MARSVAADPISLLDVWASVFFDGSDDQVDWAAPSAFGDAPWTICGRIFPQQSVVDVGAAVVLGPAANYAYAAIGVVPSGGVLYVGARLTGLVFKSDIIATPRWFDVALRYAGGAGGALTLHVEDKTYSNTASMNITTTFARLGRSSALNWPFRGCVSDPCIFNADIGAAGVEAWRLGRPPTEHLVGRLDTRGGITGAETTLRDLVAKTDHAISGALLTKNTPSPLPPVVHDIPAAAHTSGSIAGSIVDNADLDPELQSWAFMEWLRFDDEPTASRYIVYRANATDGWCVYQDGANKVLRCFFRSGGAAQYPIISTRQTGWHHVAIVLDRTTGTVRCYFDGGPPVSYSIAGFGGIRVASTSWFGSGGAGDALVAHNDRCIVKGRVVTWAEVRNHMRLRDPPTQIGSEKVLAWESAEGSGTTCRSKPAGYDVTLGASSWTTATRCKAREAATGREAA